jgi:hypothetical protein
VSLAFLALLYVRELALGLRLEKCRSTHFNIANTESVEERRRSADVLIMWDDAIRNVAAIPLRACNIFNEVYIKFFKNNSLLCNTVNVYKSSHLRYCQSDGVDSFTTYHVCSISSTKSFWENVSVSKEY